MNADASRWTIVHEFHNHKRTLCAKITSDGACMDIKNRKLATPTPAIALEIMNSIPKIDNFIVL